MRYLILGTGVTTAVNQSTGTVPERDTVTIKDELELVCDLSCMYYVLKAELKQITLKSR